MTKLSILTCASLLLLSGQVFAQETELTNKDSITTIVEKYYTLNLKVFQKGSEVSDIDNIFNLFTEDFTYVHPKYGGIYSRQDLYEGYVRNQRQGSYNGSIIDIKVTQKIVGLNAVAIAKQFITKKEGRVYTGNEEMTLFEFRDGKISKIFEYW